MAEQGRIGMARIINALSLSETGSCERVHVSTRGGQGGLGGFVNTDYEKGNAEIMVQSDPGVQVVYNRITLNPKAP